MVEVRGEKEEKKHTADPNKRAAAKIEALVSVIGEPWFVVFSLE